MSNRLRVRSEVIVKTTLRGRVLGNAMTKFVGMVGEYTDDIGFYIERMGVIVSNQMINALDLVIYDDGRFVGSVSFMVDWARHETLCSVKNEIEDSDLEDGKMYLSTTELFAVLEKYLDGLWSASKKPSVKIWYTANRLVQDRMGESAFNKLLGVHHSPEDQRRMAADWSEVCIERERCKARSTVLPDQSEAQVSIR